MSQSQSCWHKHFLPLWGGRIQSEQTGRPGIIHACGDQSLRLGTPSRAACQTPPPSWGHRMEIQVGPCQSPVSGFQATGTNSGWCEPKRILLSHKKKWNWVICSEVDGSRDCHTEWGKSEREKQIPYAITYIWIPRKEKNGSEERRGRTVIKTQT